jgi:FdhD/NarQ family
MKERFEAGIARRFEIVQKAVVTGIATLASVSAASSLAIDLARAMRVWPQGHPPA